MIKVNETIPKNDAKQIEMHKIGDFVELIPYFNNEDQNQEGRGFKILTPIQMLSRLPINLAQFKAGNNSETRKNEIR